MKRIDLWVVCLVMIMIDFFAAEMHGYVSADRYFADIRNSHGYG